MAKVTEQDICEEYRDDIMVEDWAWCLNVSVNHSSFLQRDWTVIREMSTNFSCTAYFQQNIGYEPVLYRVVIPVLCFLGIIGNILNIYVLTRGKILRVLDALERSAIFGLIALALSDMMFCACVLPNAVVTQEMAQTWYASSAFSLYYRLYSLGVINTFVMASSWLIVTMAVNRLIVVVYPIQARFLISEARAVIGILCVFIFSLLSTLPFFLLRSIRSCVSPDGTKMVEAITTRNPETFMNLAVYIAFVWPVFCHFIPFAILFMCNVGIIVALNRAAHGRRESSAHKVRGAGHNKVTVTLIAIVVMYAILVFPGEVFKYVHLYRHDDTSFAILEAFNFLQTINFTCNFVLYCLVNPTFRKTSRDLLACCMPQKHRRASAATRFTELHTRSVSKSSGRPLPRSWRQDTL